MDVIDILQLFGGVGLFLFGMSYMGQSLERLAGNGMERILQTLTTSKKKVVGLLKGFILGLVVTGIIQSSSATTIMLIGFVSAGMMKVNQAIRSGTMRQGCCCPQYVFCWWKPQMLRSRIFQR